ncbi:MAG: hypothetical protein PHW76_08110 [Alphaproteobacteria bacterium]|nr:hypothetical protein [Alphaproteobacteria bacterium]
MRRILLLSAILVLSACAGIQGDQKEETAPPAVAQKADVPAVHPAKPKPSATKPNFACTNNVKFNLNFSKNRRFAYIIFPSSGVKETLKDTRIASGMEYGNGKLFFREYQRHAELVHSVHGKAKTERCHEIFRQSPSYKN